MEGEQYFLQRISGIEASLGWAIAHHGGEGTVMDVAGIMM